jgi:hypothetical protein
MAKLYSENYGLIDFAGTDNHSAGGQKTFAGMCSDTPVVNEEDFIKRVFDRQMKVFSAKRDDLIK